MSRTCLGREAGTAWPAARRGLGTKAGKRGIEGTKPMTQKGQKGEGSLIHLLPSQSYQLCKTPSLTDFTNINPEFTPSKRLAP